MLKKKKNIVLAAHKSNWKCERIGCFNRKKTKGILGNLKKRNWCARKKTSLFMQNIFQNDIENKVTFKFSSERKHDV